MFKRLRGLAGIGAVTATVTLLVLQPVSFDRGAPTVFLVVVGGWLFLRGAFLAAAGLFAAADDSGDDWRLWLVPFQIFLGFGALYAALWRLDPGSLVGAGLEPPLRKFSVFAASFGGFGGIAPESTTARVALAAEVVVVAIMVGALVRRLHRPTGWVLGAVAIVLAGGIALSFGEERRLGPDFERGITLTAYGAEAYASDAAYNAMREARDLGAEWVTIVPARFQEKKNFNGPRVDPQKTQSDSSVETVIGRAHDLGMKVTLKPHVDLDDGSSRTEIRPDSLDEWFKSYEGMLSLYADIAERTGAEQLVVGTELKALSGETDRWRGLIDMVRGRYRGKLTYAANWDEFDRVRFWDALDAIGVDAYFPLDADDSLGDAVKAWDKWIEKVDRVRRRYDKDVLLTEIGYPDTKSALAKPYDASGPRDAERQKIGVEAALTVWTEPDWAAGMSWWQWASDLSVREPYALNEQPAAEVIREWYSD